MTSFNQNTVNICMDLNNNDHHGGSKSQDDLNISIVEESDEIDGYETSFSKIKFAGQEINYVIINTLRRVILSLIPTYGFDSNNINITKNTSVFNNDYLRLRLSNFPIYLNKDLNNKYSKLKKLDYTTVISPITTLDNSADLEYKANLGSAEIDLIEESLKNVDITDNLTIVVNVKNTSDSDIMDVMTNTPGVKFYLGKEQISHIYANPLLFVQLQPLQEFACTMISSLNIGMHNAIFRPCTMCYYDEINDNEFDFTVMSRRQISEQDLLIRACNIIKKKVKTSEQTIIDNINKYGQEVNKKLIEEDKTDDFLHNGTIIIDGEQHTLGNLFSKYLQDNADIDFAGYKVGHPNVSQVEIKYICKSDIIKVVKEVTKKIHNIYEKIENKITSMKHFGYTL